MMTFVIVIHIIVCAALIGLVLIQRGRGSGLVESFQGVESMFGTKTNTFLTRTTTVLSVVFFLSCLSLAVLSVRQSRSLMRDVKVKELPMPKQGLTAQAAAKPATQELPTPQPVLPQKVQDTQELPKTE